MGANTRHNHLVSVDEGPDRPRQLREASLLRRFPRRWLPSRPAGILHPLLRQAAIAKSPHPSHHHRWRHEMAVGGESGVVRASASRRAFVFSRGDSLWRLEEVGSLCHLRKAGIVRTSGELLLLQGTRGAGTIYPGLPVTTDHETTEKTRNTQGAAEMVGRGETACAHQCPLSRSSSLQLAFQRAKSQFNELERIREP